MKKQYIKPQMEVVKMTVSLLLSNSQTTSINGNSGLDLGGGNNGVARGRESYDWDEEW